MKRQSNQANKENARKNRWLALLSFLIVTLVAAAAWRYPPSSVAGGSIPKIEMYLPLIDQDAGNDAAATATAAAASATVTATVTQNATATANPTATATSETAQAVNISGTVFLRPQYSQQIVIQQPATYVVVLDTSGSMNLNFDGEAKDGATTLQCGPSNDPARQAKYQQDYTRCQQINAMWLPKDERRIAIAKAALMTFIDQMTSDDAMQIIASSSAYVGAITAGWEYGTPAGRQNLKDAVLNAGKTNNDPYQASGGTTSATGLSKAREIMLTLPPQAPDSQEYWPDVIFLTDGPANYFLKPTGNPAGFGWFNDARDNPLCKNRWDLADAVTCHYGLTNTNPQIERPISAMLTQANELKKTSIVHVTALTDVNTMSLNEVSSQTTFPYYSEAHTLAMVTSQLDSIQASNAGTSCLPQGGTSWIGTIDSTHTITDSAVRSRVGLPADQAVYGYAYLSDANGQALQSAPIELDATGQLSYKFTNIAPGTYHLASFAAYQGDDQPTRIARIYDWILFPDLSHETSRIFSLAPSQTGDPVELDPLYLDMQGSVCLAV